MAMLVCGPTINYFASSNVANDLAISYSNQSLARPTPVYTFKDAADGINGGAPNASVTCPAAGVDAVVVNVVGGNDKVTVNGSNYGDLITINVLATAPDFAKYTYVYTGGGNDGITIGPNLDNIASPVYVSGMEGNDTLVLDDSDPSADVETIGLGFYQRWVARVFNMDDVESVGVIE